MITGSFTGWLKLGYIDGRKWVLIRQEGDEPFGYKLYDGRHIIPPEGFVTDFASIPRYFWRVLPPTGDGSKGRYGICAVIHDYLYHCHEIEGVKIERKMADDIFLSAMKAVDVAPWRTITMYYAVRLFAGFAW